MISDLLLQSFALQERSDLFQKWKASNPGEFSKVKTYIDSGGTPPVVKTLFGQHLVKEAQALWASLPAPTPTPPPPSTHPIPIGATTRIQNQSASVGVNLGPGTFKDKEIYGATDFGIVTSGWANGGPVKVAGALNLENLHIHDIGRNPPLRLNPSQAAAGTVEHGIFTGLQTFAKQLLIERCAWDAICPWGINSPGSVYEDFHIRECAWRGIYIEHVTNGVTFKNGKIEMVDGALHAIQAAEWWNKGQSWYWPYSGYPGISGTWGNTFDTIEIYVPKGCWAMYFDAGTFGNRTMNIKAYGPGNGIIYNEITMNPSKPNWFDWPSIDLSGIQGIKQATHRNPTG